MKFDVLLADPPWKYKDKRNHSSMGMAESSYSTMQLQDIMNLPVQEVMGKNSLCFLWCTKPKLPEGLKTLEAWGYEYITTPFVWVKLNPTVKNIKAIYPDIDVYSGLGHWTNGNVEDVLLGRKGKAVKRIDFSVKQIIFSPRGQHSAKPKEIYTRINKLVGDKVSKLELFAREIQLGWTCLGNEIDNKDIKEAILELISKS